METKDGKRWYLQDLDNYTSEFLQEIIIDLIDKRNTSSKSKDM